MPRKRRPRSPHPNNENHNSIKRRRLNSPPAGGAPQAPKSGGDDIVSNNNNNNNNTRSNKRDPYSPAQSSRIRYETNRFTNALALPSNTTAVPPRRPIVEDDDEGHLIYSPGDVIQNRYQIMEVLGEGTFGKVVRTIDMCKNRIVALKIIKNVKKYREAARLEINVLSKILKYDPKAHLCFQQLETNFAIPYRYLLFFLSYFSYCLRTGFSFLLVSET